MEIGNQNCIRKTIFFIERNGNYYGTENRRIPCDTESGNSLLWYINEYGFRKKPNLKGNETLHTTTIIVPENWKK